MKAERAFALVLVIALILSILASPKVLNYSSATTPEEAGTQFQLPSLLFGYNASSTVIVTYIVQQNPFTYNEPVNLTVKVEIPDYWLSLLSDIPRTTTTEVPAVDVTANVQNAVESLGGYPVSFMSLIGPYKDYVNVVDQLYMSSEIVNFTTSGFVGGWITILAWPDPNMTGNWQPRTWTIFNSTSMPIEQKGQQSVIVITQPQVITTTVNGQIVTSTIQAQTSTTQNSFSLTHFAIWIIVGIVVGGSLIIGALFSYFGGGERTVEVLGDEEQSKKVINDWKKLINRIRRGLKRAKDQKHK